MSRKSKHLPKSVLLEETGSPVIIKLVILFSILVVGGFLVWSHETRLSEVSIAAGTIVPQGNIRKVQHLTGGQVERLFVEEGQVVKKGERLMTIIVPVVREGIEFHEKVAIRSPGAGVLHSLKVTARGEVVMAGETLAEIIPQGVPLIAEIRISPQDIGHVGVGDEVRLKFTAFDFARYGGLAGTLVKVSGTTISKSNQDPYYQGWVKPAALFIGTDQARNQLIPGMILSAEIKTGEKTILEYLLKPIFTSANEAMRER